MTAPVTEAEYRASALLAMPTDFTGDKATTLLNSAWQSLVTWAKQPLSSTANTEVYSFPGRKCNATPEGIIQIAPPNTPIISVTSINFSSNVIDNGWSPATHFDLVDEGDIIRVYDGLFSRGDHGVCQLVYTSGYATIPDDLKMACKLMTSVLLSAGFFPTQAGASVLPDWVYGANRESYFQIKRTMDFYMRVR